MNSRTCPICKGECAVSEIHGTVADYPQNIGVTWCCQTCGFSWTVKEEQAGRVWTAKYINRYEKLYSQIQDQTKELQGYQDSDSADKDLAGLEESKGVQECTRGSEVAGEPGGIPGDRLDYGDGRRADSEGAG